MDICIHIEYLPISNRNVLNCWYKLKSVGKLSMFCHSFETNVNIKRNISTWVNIPVGIIKIIKDC